ncbi:hypothetical protein BZA70DRAFT_29059 [Myxozyma melibiosi]|uniref:WHIM1 domain-containing protein n=1 Tax=Myxozyma melibiosi TaxID=54550 RepID=A0ABR1FDG1_9ASCO
MSTSSGFDSDSSLSPPPALLSSPVPASKPKTQSRPRKNRQATLDFRPQPVAPRVPFTDRPRDEDIFAAAVAASKADPVSSDAQTKSQDGQPSKFSSVLDEIMSDDDDDAGSTSFNSSTIGSRNPKSRSRGGRKPAARKQNTSSPAPAVVKTQRRPRKPNTTKLANPIFKHVSTPSSAGGSAAPSPLASSIASPAPSASGDAAAGSSSGELSSPPSDFEPEFLLNNSDLDDEGDDDEEDDKAVPDAVKSESQAEDQKPSDGKENSETKKPERKRLIPNPREPMYAPEISFLVMFRARFAEVYAGFPDLGPQDFEEGLVSSPASPAVLGFLCRTLSLVLNRKKNVEPAHFARPMDEAVSTYGPAYWGPLNPTGPFVGGLTFHTMTWEARLEVLVALVHWSLTASEAVRQVLVQGYSQQRTDDDSASPLAVLPIGLDSERKRYYLIEGENDTRFRLFCETNPRQRLVNWTPVASTFAEFKEFVDKLSETDTSRNAKALVESLTEELPRLEASELKRRKRDQRMLKRQYDEMQAADTGLYSGRTRGKKVNYTNDGGVVGEEEEEDEYGDEEEEEEVERKASATKVYTTASGRASRKPPVPAAFIDPGVPDISDEDTAESSSKREVRKTASAGRQQYVYPNGAEEDDEDKDVFVDAEKPSLTVVLKYRKTNRDIPMTDVAPAPQAVALESR